MLKVIDDTSVKRKNGDNEKSNFAKRGRERGWDGKEKVTDKLQIYDRAFLIAFLCSSVSLSGRLTSQITIKSPFF